jgi:hypothetical protein
MAFLPPMGAVLGDNAVWPRVDVIQPIIRRVLGLLVTWQ